MRTLSVALAQALAAVRQIAVLVALRITFEAQLKRIELERDREFVHRAFESIDAGCGTGRAHVARGLKIEPRELVRILRMGALVEQARPAGLLPMEIFVLRRDINSLVRDRIERSISICAELDLLDHRRPIAEPVHLLAGEHETYRAFDGARRQCCQHHIILRA